MKSFAERSGRHKALEVLRWLCVLPAAYFGSQISILLARLMVPLAVAQPGGTLAAAPSDFQRLIAPWFFTVLTGPAFVIAGSLVAPRFRRGAAVVLAILWTLNALQSHVLVHLGRGTPHYDHFAAATLSAAAAAGLICYLERRRQAQPS